MKSSEITNKLVLTKSHSDNGTFSSQDKIGKIHKTLNDALKIISISMLIDDDKSSDFLSEYANYKVFYSSLIKLNLSKDEIKTEEEFLKEPVKYWMELISEIFIILYMLPFHSGIVCDNIGEEKVLGKKEINSLASCLTYYVNLEAYDWKTHKISLYLPSSNDSKTLFMIDDEVVLYD